MIINTFHLFYLQIFSRGILFKTYFGLQIERWEMDKSDGLQELDLRQVFAL